MPPENETTNAAWVKAARTEWAREGDIEIDDDAAVSVCPEGAGAYVQAWVFVRREEL